MGILKHKPFQASKLVRTGQVIAALDYFAIPQELWPTGLQLLPPRRPRAQHWLERDRQAAQDIVKQVSGCLLAAYPTDMADCVVRPPDVRDGAVSLGMIHIKDHDPAANKYCIEWGESHDQPTRRIPDPACHSHEDRGPNGQQIWGHNESGRELQKRLAPSVVTHKTSTLHPYNTRQQTGLASQQLNICEAMPSKCTPTENNRHCAQAVLELLTACCSHKAAGLHRCSKY